MKTRSHAVCRAFGLVALVIALAIVSPLRSGASPNPSIDPAPAALQAVSANNEKPSTDPAVYHAGTLDPLDTPTIQHTFLLKNTSAAPLKILQLTSSCSCTTGVVTANGRSQALPLTLAPGQVMGLDVQVAVESSVQGVLTKYVWVAAEGQKDPAATLEITADFPPLIAFTSPTLDLGTVRAGAGESVVVTALVSPQVKLGETIVELTSTLPYLAVGPPAAARTGKSPTSAGDPWPKLAYTITLAKDSPIGPFVADLDVHLTRIGPFGQAAGQDLPNSFMVARGSVVGDISIEPKNLVFGAVAQGKSATKSVTITSTSPAVLAGLSAKSNNPSLVVKRTPAAPAATSVVYDILIGGSAPAGICEAKITFVTASGQVLVLPVLAYVTAGAGQ